MQTFGLTYLALTTIGVAHAGIFLARVVLDARKMHLPLIASALCGAVWVCSAHVFVSIPYLWRIVSTDVWVDVFDEFYLATRLIFTLGIIRIMEPCRAHLDLDPFTYYATVVGVYMIWSLGWLMAL